MNYYDMRDATFPGIQEELNQYRTVGSYILSQFPQLSEYWDWNRSYKNAYPVIEKYTTGPKEDNYVQVYDYSFVKNMDKALVRGLYLYFLGGVEVTSGSMASLESLHRQYGKGFTFEDWLNTVVKSVISP